MDDVNDQEIAPPLTAALLSLIPLGLSLWFDPGRYAILRNGEYLPLTAQEVIVFSRLLKTPYRYVHTALLIRCLSSPGRLMTSTHSVEQIICQLRRKLGDDKKRPRLILNRYKLGYGIFPEAVTPMQSLDTGQNPLDRRDAET